MRTIVEARRAFAPRDFSNVLGGKKALLQQVQGEFPFMVVAPSLSERARALLAENGCNFLDLAGHVRISSNFPSIYIDRVTGTKPGYPRQRAAAGIRGDKAGRIVRLLAEVMPLYGIVELADAARVTRGYVSKVAEILEREAIIGRSFRAIRLQSAAYTGSFAAAALAPVAASTTLMLDVTRDEQALVDQARLLPADHGANVFLLRPYDEVALHRHSGRGRSSRRSRQSRVRMQPWIA